MDVKRGIRAALLAAASAFLPLAGCERGDVGEGDELSEVTARVSVDFEGLEGNGDSQNAATSTDGRYAAFDSDATDLTPGDSNNHRDIFIKDRFTGEIENITLDPTVTDAALIGISDYLTDAFNPSLSGDGRYVAFESKGQFAGGFFPMSVQARKNVFVRDRITWAMVAVAGNGAPWPDEDCTDASLSSDGRYVAFVSRASNLGFTNASKIAQIYVADLSVNPPTLTLVSHATGLSTQVCNGGCSGPRISADGQFVVFSSTATNLNAGDGDGNFDVFLGTPGGANCLLVSLNSSGVKGDDHSFMAAVSGDGRFVAFYTYANNMIPGVSQFGPMIVVRDRQPGVTSLVSLSAAYVSIMMPSGDRVGISNDGQIVAFTSGSRQAMVWDPQKGERIASTYVSGIEANLNCYKADISGDGRWGVWHTRAYNLVPDDTNGVADIFVRGPLR